MNEARVLLRTPLSRAGTLLPTTAVAVLAVVAIGVLGHEVSGIPAPSGASTTSVVEQSSTAQTGETSIVLELPHGRATAVLADTPVAHQLAAALPLRLGLRDPMGQAKSGRLPRRLDSSGAEQTLDPEAGAIYYWPPSGDLAIFYDDLGQTVPPPGLIRLGTITDGLPALASAGHRFDVSVVAAGAHP